MSTRQDSALRVWALAAMALVAVLMVLPADVMERGSSALLADRSFMGLVLKTVITGTMLVVVLGFYLRMFWECGVAKDIRHRSAWLLFLIFVPIVSAFVYFWVTRSAWYSVQPR